MARVIGLSHAADDDLGSAMQWLGEASRRCNRDTDGYAALHVEILADQTALSARQGRLEAADAFGREWISRAARTHMDGHVARAAALIRNNAGAAFRQRTGGV